MCARKWLLAFLCALYLTVLPMLAHTTYAHAVLTQSDPAANAVLEEAPAEIRLWFTEPLEPTYTNFELRDANGAVVATPPSFIDPADDHQLVMQPGELPDGLYTVVWRNVSAADGHRVTGSFPFTIGAATTAAPTVTAAVVELSPFDVLARWANFVGLALAVGGIAFIVFVWQPATRSLGQMTAPRASQALWEMVWLGWWLAALGALLLLVNQTAILLNEPLADVLALDKVAGVLRDTRFGILWNTRMGLWLVMGALLLVARRSVLLAWLATLCGLLMLLPTSLHSHAAVSNDLTLSIFSDWIHLAASTLWAGGLVQLLVAIAVLRKVVQPVASNVGQVTGHFSNLARVAVAGVIISGIYATWHQVNTLEALTTTFYGQLLSIKLGLALLLLLVALVNLVWTQRRLLAGQALWVGRLRGLVTLEVALVLCVLMVAGAMTAVNPARNEMVQREIAAAIPPTPAPQPISAMEMVDDLHIMLAASPGWVGNNTFTIQLMEEDGTPITDASLIRMRFEHQSEDLGESELQIRPEAESPDGIYSIDGSNLSTTGEWRLRMTVQRPDAYDTVTDFTLDVVAPPAPPPPPVIETNPVLPYRTAVLYTLGGAALVAGLYFLAQQRFRLWQGGGLLASFLLLLGVTFLLTGMLS